MSWTGSWRSSWGRCAILLSFTLPTTGTLAQGYTASKIPGGISIAVGAERADNAAMLRWPLRFGDVTLVGVPSSARTSVDALCRARSQKGGTVSDLFALAQAIENTVRQDGSLLARVFLPPQSIRNGGPVKIEVIDVRIEALDLEALPAALAVRARHYLEPLVGRSFVRVDALAHIIGKLQLEFGVPLSTETPAGSRSDRVRLQVRGPLRGILGEIAVGKLESGPFRQGLLSTSVTGFLPSELGGRVSLSGALGQRSDPGDMRGPLWTAGAVWQAPIREDGSLFAEAGLSGARVLSQARQGADSTGYDFLRVSGRLGSPLIVGTNETVIVKVGPDHTTEGLRSSFPAYDSLIETAASQTTMMRAELTWLRQLGEGAVIELGSVASVGQTDVVHRLTFGDEAREDRRSHSVGLLAARVRATIPLWSEFALTFAGRGQIAGHGLLPLSEQFQLFRAGDVAVYDSATEQGNDGIVARVDVGRSFASAWLLPGSSLSPYAFVGGGAVWGTGEATSRRRVTGETWGMGTLLALPPRPDLPLGLSLGVELYRQITTGAMPNYTGVSMRVSNKF